MFNIQLPIASIFFLTRRKPPAQNDSSGQDEERRLLEKGRRSMRKFKLADDFGSFYRQEGYVILSDAFRHDEIAQVRADVLDLFESRFRAANAGARKGIDLLTHHYHQDKELWRQCAKRMFDLLSVYGLAAKPEVLEVLSRLGLQKPMISTRPEVRTDMPRDEQYMQGWHQDWRYGQGSYNSVTFWVPMHNVRVENGTIDVMPKTHLLGYLDCEEVPNPRRFVIQETQIKGFPFFPVELEQGEAVVFSQMLVHRSGYNRSEHPRLTTQLRFVDRADHRFAGNGFAYPRGSEMVWSSQPTANELIEVFGRAA
jgi:ectoine hydroxylase-related dioxygenase (phytanoyl-CoA dioxygenase family)